MNQDDKHTEQLEGQAGSKKPRRRTQVYLIILLIVLSAVLGYLIYENHQLYQAYERSLEDREALEQIKSNLENELRNIYEQYDSLKTENDSMNMLLEAEQEKIDRLLKINANNAYKITLYEKELKTIREVLKSYVIQIDSLNQANIALRSENIEVRQELHKARRESESLTREKEELTRKVEVASVLSAKDVNVVGLNSRNRERDRIRSIEKLRICYTLRENSVLQPGEKTIYIRIARPDEVILTSGMNFFEYEGEQIIYTASREVDYQNIDVDMCIFWTNDGQLIPGTYNLNIFAEGHKIGSGSFVLK